jgi:hypothetical protein
MMPISLQPRDRGLHLEYILLEDFISRDISSIAGLHLASTPE